MFALICFPHLAPELFNLSSSRKPGWNFSYEPKAKFCMWRGPYIPTEHGNDVNKLIIS